MFICVNKIEIAPKYSRLPQLHCAVFAKSCNKIPMGMVSDPYNFLLMDLSLDTNNFIISLKKFIYRDKNLGRKDAYSVGTEYGKIKSNLTNIQPEGLINR